jgi:divalent metal cation (Fe/Co/Zn/Cd) transporter
VRVSPASEHHAQGVVRLEKHTVLLSALEALAALVSGWWAGSAALVAFGADSLIEMLSALVVVSQVAALVGGRVPHPRSAHRSHRRLALLFFLLALYVTISASVTLVGHHHAHENALGLAVSATSSVVMPLLAWRKREAAGRLRRLGLTEIARLVRADAAETLLCATVALSTLVGVLLATWHWWWADPVASLVIVIFALREGREAWLCDPDSAEPGSGGGVR